MEAIILFNGPSLTDRQQEASILLNEGYSKIILTPAFSEISDGVRKISFLLSEKSKSHSICANMNFESIRIVENTHKEMIVARTMIEHLDIKSAPLVSSPYHMRRLKIIADSVFDDRHFSLSYIPTRFENTDKFCFTSLHDIKWVFTEYCKIL